jgi:peptide/nickel transport system substrate-binding protein
MPILALFVTTSPGFSSDDNILRMGIDASAFGTGDPHQAASRNDRAVVDMIFNGLLRYVPGNAPSIEPDLALAFPEPVLSNGRQTWVFELRRDVYCHPGPETGEYQLTADDVLYSLQRSANPESSAYAGDYQGMTASKIDNFTIAISFDTPLSSILFFPKVSNYAGGLIVCSRAERAMGREAFARHPVGTGPFRFQSLGIDNTIRLEPNDRYFRGVPRLNGVEVHYLPTFSIRAQALKDGELDVIFGSESSPWTTSGYAGQSFMESAATRFAQSLQRAWWRTLIRRFLWISCLAA